jgi:hypothetical protein
LHKKQIITLFCFNISGMFMPMKGAIRAFWSYSRKDAFVKRTVRNTCVMVASMLTLVLLCGTRAAWADATTAAVSDEVRQLRVELENMRQSNEQLRQQVSQIQASSNENWLSERRQEEVKQLVREVLSDADTRASLLEGGMNAGYVPGKGFILSAEDGSFLMNIYGQMQIRYMWTDRKDPGAGQDAGENGFTLRRMKVGFKGYIGSPKIEYTMLLASHVRGDGQSGRPTGPVQGSIHPRVHDVHDEELRVGRLLPGRPLQRRLRGRRSPDLHR